VTPALEARGLRVARGGRLVLDSVDLALLPGQAMALIGPNAAGKSTLLRALAGLLEVSSGEVRLEGRALGSWDRPAVGRRLALVAAEDEAPDRLTVEDRVSLGRYPHRGPLARFTAEDEAAVARALQLTQIEHLAGRRLGTLSAGERQRALVARGLAQSPSVLLLDEPASHLDVRQQLHLFRVLDEVRQQGVAVLAVIHDLQRAAWASQVALLASGRIAAIGAPAEVIESEAAARAFGVTIRGVAVDDGAFRLWQFEERP
jgi:iron complex transport system ATP-binding protein